MANLMFCASRSKLKSEHLHNGASLADMQADLGRADTEAAIAFVDIFRSFLRDDEPLIV